MPNPMEMLRLRNLFNPGAMQSSTYDTQFLGASPQMEMDDSPAPYDVAARMKQLYSPETMASDKFNEMNANFPQFEKPSKMRRFGAAALGSLTDLGTNFGGNKTGIKGTDVFDETTGRNRYRENVADWKTKIGPAQQAADNERQSNALERQMAYGTVSQEQNTRKLEETERKNKESEAVKKQRADVYDFKTKHPAHKLMQGKDGILRAVNPTTNEVITLGKTGMSDKEVDDLNQTQALDRIDAGGFQARETEDKRQSGRETLSEGKAWTPFNLSDGTPVLINSQTGETKKLELPTAGPITKIGTPSSGGGAGSSHNELLRRFNNATEFASKNPNLAKWIKLNPKDSSYNVTKSNPSSWTDSGKGPTEVEYNQIMQAIYGSSGQSNTNTGAGPTNTAAQGNAPKAPAGWKYVRKPGGGWTAVQDQ